MLLEPENWIGKPLPVAGNIVDYLELADFDEHVILFYRGDCDLCESAINALRIEQRQVFFVDILNANSSSESRPNWLEMDDSRNWRMETPVKLTMKDGIIIDVETHDDLIGVSDQ